jgi:hypothetical protein
MFWYRGTQPDAVIALDAASIIPGKSPRQIVRQLWRAVRTLLFISKRSPKNVTDFPQIVFDVNETLLDLRTMEPTFERIFGESGMVRLSFANLILYSAALTVAECYVPFADIGGAVMKMLADA